MLSTRPHHPLFTSFFIALLGVFFSLWNALDSASVPCMTAGCTLYQSFSLGGFSLWWVGVATFLLLGLLALLGYGSAGRIVAGLALLADCFLLLIMILTLPCLACMLEAVLLAGCYYTFRRVSERPVGRRQASFSLLLGVWGILFVLVFGFAVRGEVQPWAIQEPETVEGTPVRVFFSPSCSACRQLVTGISEADSRKIIWCPVAEDEKDIAVILNLQQRLNISGAALSAQFLSALEAEPLSMLDMLRPSTLLLQFRLWCNQAHVLASGEGRLPLVEFMGVPSALIRNSGVSGGSLASDGITAQSFGGQSPIGDRDHGMGLPFDLEGSGSCGGPNAVPCP